MELNDIKKRFFAMRNGIVADILRRQNPEYRTVFGLNLPQLTEIAREVGTDPTLAAKLWADSGVRESQMLAPMLLDPATMTESEAIALAMTAATREVADTLCLKLLRRTPVAMSVARNLTRSKRPIDRYTGLRLLFNLLPTASAEAYEAASAELALEDPLTHNIAALLLQHLQLEA